MKIGVIAFGCLAAVTGYAQSGAAGFFNPLSSSRDGIHLYGATVYGGYFSGGTPFGVPTNIGGSTFSGTSATITGVTGNFGWTNNGERSSISITYTPTYMVYPDATELNSFGQSFSLSWNRKLGQKWSLSASATGLIADMQQRYFSSNAFGLAASLPTTIEDLAGALLAGKFTDAQLAASLTGVSARLLPEQTYLYGQRIGSASLQVGVNYAQSGRSSFHISASANRVQGLSSNQSDGVGTRSPIPQTTASGMSFGWNYSLSPRTNFGIEAGTFRTFSRLQDGYSSHGGISIGRTVTQHLFVQGRLGGGIITYNRKSFAAPQRPQYTAGGSVGYKFRTHTFLASFDRSIGDAYGLGANTTNSATAGWAWKVAGSRWSLSANYGYQRTEGSTFLNTESWRATGGVARALASNLFISVQYAYLVLPTGQAALIGVPNADSGVSLGLSWSPSPYR